jgi:hypothetical protein
MTVIIQNSAGENIRKSQNLRAITEHNRRQTVDVALLSRYGQAGVLTVQWVNGDACHTQFASFQVMQDWVSRRRAFKGATITTI